MVHQLFEGTSHMAHREEVPAIVSFVEELAIIPPELFQAIQESRDNPSLAGYVERRKFMRNIRYLLSGVTMCPSCGGRMTLISGVVTMSIGCRSQISDRCSSLTFGMAPLERCVIEGLREIVEDKGAMEAFVLEARKANDDLERVKEDRRERLQKQAREIDARLEKAVDNALFGNRRLDERREKKLEALEDRLQSIRSEIALLDRPSPSSLPPEAIGTLKDGFDEIIAAAPFVPRKTAEIVVFQTLRKLVSRVTPTRLDKRTVDVDVEYDLGPVLGFPTTDTIVRKTLRYNGHANLTYIKAERAKSAAKAVQEGMFTVPDEMLDRVDGLTDFAKSFGDRDRETRRTVVRSMLFKAAYEARLKQKVLIDPADRPLRRAILDFRASRQTADFILIALSIFPNEPLRLSALAVRKGERPCDRFSILETSRTLDDAFLKLRMCRSETESTIPDRHWQTILRERCAQSRSDVDRSPDKFAKQMEPKRKIFQAVAHVVRCQVEDDAGAEAAGITVFALRRGLTVLREDGRFTALAARLLQLQERDEA